MNPGDGVEGSLAVREGILHPLKSTQSEKRGLSVAQPPMIVTVDA